MSAYSVSTLIMFVDPWQNVTQALCGSDMTYPRPK
jgi:hypothetical protein